MTGHKFGQYARQIITYTWWKGLIDRVVALLALCVLSPFLIIIAIAVRIDSAGSPIFRQERVGKNGRRFMIFKFRSMYRDNDDSKYKGFLRKYINEKEFSTLDENGEDIRHIIGERVTRVGYWLRRFSLDELPQLVNILKGDMALIGPRPDIPFAVEMYTEQHKGRLEAKPGLLGLWQISGRRSLSFEEMVKLDIQYIKQQSPLLDAKIVLFTVREILTRDKGDI
jgi:lipopolysaccharide/colanic/teichoic acid biosynthesis glycosyltransferase